LNALGVLRNLVSNEVDVTVSDLGDEYWYAFKAKEAITTKSRAAAAARHLIWVASIRGWEVCI
jgi:hypothetical protein